MFACAGLVGLPSATPSTAPDLDENPEMKDIEQLDVATHEATRNTSAVADEGMDSLANALASLRRNGGGGAVRQAWQIIGAFANYNLARDSMTRAGVYSTTRSMHMYINLRMSISTRDGCTISTMQMPARLHQEIAPSRLPDKAPLRVSSNWGVHRLRLAYIETYD
ncbi:unnamed protein product [Aphanomyces euteiches]|uniref:Uncharacterized protein n=1 Tax=Aphanomyces euteiches TaxID=100861 RepID=A0A6G0W8V2_9STRA|nr:hypothetical protein Ae201684_017516 [Aphanomyces euteiches]KAH9068865.1 hypothetical protein Ae201684P_004563 [Aphanomyces euteiches]KAH9142560.1 hypothetical protein AeRB84_013375 [Aphanomyces euteiches]